MSASAVKWAKRQTVDDRTVTAVLLAIARLAKGNVCASTQGAIACEANLKERSVRSALSCLEHFQMIRRDRRQNWTKKGRAADFITLALDQDFNITKENIMSHRSMGPTGTESGKTQWDQPARHAGAPMNENEHPPYRVRARSVVVDSSPSSSFLSVSVSTRVRYERGRDKWRASITAYGVTMELGRFDTKSEAEEYAEGQMNEVIRTSTAKAGTPAFPKFDPSKANLNAPDLGRWLFGYEGEDDSEGAGEAGASGQGTKFLAGMGGAHEPTEFYAARD
ncbi:hypothetical protein [Rhizobium sp. Root149]|uniref:hypothetical protein n=1 Tax=Rhizobium sp. Root149 TaxID=1736473 RepID=UPI0012E3D158|nr:hypothetical protein [Rhizobium sp. Root149]